MRIFPFELITEIYARIKEFPNQRLGIGIDFADFCRLTGDTQASGCKVIVSGKFADEQTGASMAERLLIERFNLNVTGALWVQMTAASDNDCINLALLDACNEAFKKTASRLPSLFTWIHNSHYTLVALVIFSHAWKTGEKSDMHVFELIDDEGDLLA